MNKEKNFLILILILIIPLFISGCFLFKDDEIADAEMNVAIDEVVAIDKNNENMNSESGKDEESAEEAEVEELKLEDIFVGTWWMYLKYPDFNGEAELSIFAGSYDSRDWYKGKMQAIKSAIYSNDDSVETEAKPTGEVIDFEIDGQKIRFSSEGASFYGRIKLEKNKSYASGNFDSTLGPGTWYMTNIEADDNWGEL